MQKVGKLLVCDRCGNQVFRAHIDTKTRDGGFTVIDTYEPKPEGWLYSSDLGMDLCPECSYKYNQIKFDFIEEAKEK